MWPEPNKPASQARRFREGMPEAQPKRPAGFGPSPPREVLVPFQEQNFSHSNVYVPKSPRFSILSGGASIFRFGRARQVLLLLQEKNFYFPFK